MFVNSSKSLPRTLPGTALHAKQRSFDGPTAPEGEEDDAMFGIYSTIAESTPPSKPKTSQEKQDKMELDEEDEQDEVSSLMMI